MISRFCRSRLPILVLIFLSTSTYSSSQLEVGDWDIDDGRADALTDGLFFLRHTFGLRGDALISGLISSGSEYTTASDIERELALVYDASGDIDGDGNIDEGDWIEYSVDVKESGEYSFEYRLASLIGSSGFESLVDVQTVPSTRG